MLKKITEKEYLSLAENGARVLFDIADYRLMDGVKDEDESYFIVDFSNDQMYQINLKDSYDLLAIYVCKDVPRKYLLERIEELLENE